MLDQDTDQATEEVVLEAVEVQEVLEEEVVVAAVAAAEEEEEAPSVMLN